MQVAGRSIGFSAILVAGVAALVAAAMLLIHRTPSVGDIPRAIHGAPAAAVPPPPWTGPQLRDLIDAIDGSAQQGLRPGDYDRAALKIALGAQGASRSIDALATHAAQTLAHDYAAGRIHNRHRFNWYIPYAGPSPAALGDQIVKARQAGSLRDWLDGLLPDEPDYAALRSALARTPADDVRRRERIEANMERWRWLPRSFGTGDMLYVNLPTYRLDVIENGGRTASYRAVIGATDMPTPVLSAEVRRVVVNPDWIVPHSIVLKSHLRPGASSRYEFSTRPDGTVRVRQKPGTGNALGKVKIEFPNPLAIYFHDTPSRSLFGRDVRAFSHGCVRVQHVDALAASLVGDADRFAAALAGDQTRSFATARPWRATIVYLTLVRNMDGNLTDVGDPYKLDEPMAEALEGRKAGTGQAVPKASKPVAPRSAKLMPDSDDAVLDAPKIDAAMALNDQL